MDVYEYREDDAFLTLKSFLFHFRAQMLQSSATEDPRPEPNDVSSTTTPLLRPEPLLMEVTLHEQR